VSVDGVLIDLFVSWNAGEADAGDDKMTATDMASDDPGCSNLPPHVSRVLSRELKGNVGVRIGVRCRAMSASQRPGSRRDASLFC
jgi:hypothetical protein